MSSPRARKRFGQNFLISDEVIGDIVAKVRSAGEYPIVEIGPGKGALTIPLAAAGLEILAVEFDREVVKFLKAEVAPYQNVTLMQADFLSLSAADIPYERFQLVGNLPYNITSPVLDWTVANRDRISNAIFMVQKEVSARLVSKPGTKDWSPMAIITGCYFEIKHCLDVDPDAFDPPPKVQSAVISLVRRQSEPGDSIDLVERVVRQAFKQRRKQLLNNLVPDLIADVGIARNILAELDLPGNIRAEQISTKKFFELTDLLLSYKILNKN